VELPRLISSENVVYQDLRRNSGYSPSKFHLENTYIRKEVGVMWNYTYLKNQGLITRSGKKVYHKYSSPDTPNHSYVDSTGEIVQKTIIQNDGFSITEIPARSSSMIQLLDTKER
jgi:hypothetical protein